MSDKRSYWLNKMLLSAGAFAHYRYHASAHRTGEIQQQKLRTYLTDNQGTIYGKKYGFAGIRDYDSFAANVPVIDNWQQVEDYIEKIKTGASSVLCNDRIDVFEETSGSTGFSKLIPYNKTLRNEFQSAFQVWMIDLYKTSPQSFYGKSYWSLSPVLKEKKNTACGIPIGLENDTDYFSPLTKLFLSHTLAVGSDVIKMKDPDAFYFETVKQLLLQKNLSLVSVWSPSFFLRLDEFLRSHFTSLLQHICPISKSRYDELKAAGEQFVWKDIWTDLSCVSCWTDAQAAFWIPQVKRLLGDVFIQPKGLLSTEAVISIPVKDAPYAALAYQSHFFEFRNVDDSSVLLAHQLQKDNCYEVIVTTGGGLYRYATKDVVQVKGFYKQVPLLLFLGRSNRTSDMVGEKVSEIQVNKIISELFAKEEARIVFIKPYRMEKSGRYILYAEAEPAAMSSEEIVQRFEANLCLNPYYKQALETGQLQPMQYRIPGKDFRNKMIEHYTQKGIGEGNIKLPALLMADELNELNQYL